MIWTGESQKDRQKNNIRHAGNGLGGCQQETAAEAGSGRAGKGRK